MDFHIITSRGAELVMRVDDGVLEVPPAPAEAIMDGQLASSKIPSKTTL